jgi:hypothetical protein
VYLVSEENGENQSSSSKFGSSILNSLVIIAVITVATFVLVLCYKYRCMKVGEQPCCAVTPPPVWRCRRVVWIPRAVVASPPHPLLQLMIGYLIFASANLLGYTGGFVVYTALKVYNIVMDWPTLFFLMYNFAAAGVVAVFWQKVPARLAADLWLLSCVPMSELCASCAPLEALLVRRVDFCWLPAAGALAQSPTASMPPILLCPLCCFGAVLLCRASRA